MEKESKESVFISIFGVGNCKFKIQNGGSRLNNKDYPMRCPFWKKK